MLSIPNRGRALPHKRCVYEVESHFLVPTITIRLGMASKPDSHELWRRYSAEALLLPDWVARISLSICAASLSVVTLVREERVELGG